MTDKIIEFSFGGKNHSVNLDCVSENYGGFSSFRDKVIQLNDDIELVLTGYEDCHGGGVNITYWASVKLRLREGEAYLIGKKTSFYFPNEPKDFEKIPEISELIDFYRESIEYVIGNCKKELDDSINEHKRIADKLTSVRDRIS